MGEMLMQDRDPIFDIAKFLLMLCVVAGHLAGNGIIALNIDEASWFYNARMGIAMPCFFAISGYFAYGSYMRGDWNKIVARTVGFLWPLFAFGVVFAIVLFVTGVKTPFQAFIHPLGRVIGGSWFLMTLAIVYVVAAGIVRLLDTQRSRIICSILVYGVFLFCPRNGALAWTASVMHMFPYFMFGVLGLKLRELHKRHMVTIFCGVFFILVVMLEGNCRTNGMSFYWVSSDWHDMLLTGHGLVCFLGRTAVGISGTTFFLWLIDVVVRLLPRIGYMGKFGTTSLGVYVMHEWPMVQLGNAGLMQGFPSWMQWPLALFIFFTFHYLTLGLRAVPSLKFFFFGDEKWLAKVLRNRKLFAKIRI